jgi:cell shape-determining protein MreC
MRPGLIALSSVRQRAEATLGLVGNLGTTARHAAEQERELAELRERVGQLEAETIWLRSMKRDAADEESLLAKIPPLVRPRLVETRVLGRQAQHALARQGLLDAGIETGISEGDLLLDVPSAMIDVPSAMIERGAAAGTAPGQLVLAGRRVWGKVAQVQSRVSLVRRATDAGYRDVVRIAQPNGERLAIGPRGMLEGSGESLCRLRLVPLTEAVAVGQWVVTEGGEGFVDGRFLYGYIQRVEQPPGAAHWDIWVRPAVSQDLPHKVAVLTADATAAGAKD